MPTKKLKGVYIKRMKKYIAYLRSGKYLQVDGALRSRSEDDNKLRYCCLGVACNVYRDETGKGRWKKKGEGCYGTKHVFLNSSLLMPVEVAKWLGIFDVASHDPDDDGFNPELTLPKELIKALSKGVDPGCKPNKHTSASSLNDNDKATFDQIADAFEFTYLSPKDRTKKKKAKSK